MVNVVAGPLVLEKKHGGAVWTKGEINQGDRGAGDEVCRGSYHALPEVGVQEHGRQDDGDAAHESRPAGEL